MARQAASFRNVSISPTQRFIEPVFRSPGPFTNRSRIHRTGSQTVNNSTYTLDIQPPKGELWVVEWVFGIITGVAGQDAGTRTTVKFLLKEGSNTSIIAVTSFNSGGTFAYGANTVEHGSSGQGPLLVSNDRY